MYMNIQSLHLALSIQIFFRIIKTAFLAKIDNMRLLLRLFEGFVDPGVEVMLHTDVLTSFQTLAFKRKPNMMH